MGHNETYTLSPEQKSAFYSKMIKIAIPVIIQNIISIGLGVADTMMIGKLGEAEIAGVGAGNQLFWLFWGIIFGFYSGANAHAAQYWGAGDRKKTLHVLGMDYAVGATIGLLTILSTYIVGDKLLWFFSRDPEVIEYGLAYMRVACFSYFFSFLSYAFIFNCRVVQRLTFVTSANVVSLFFNIFLNWVFIFGKLGAPRLGVVGAALATTITRAVELIAVIIYMLSVKDHPLRAKVSELLGFSREFFKKVAKTASPVVVTEAAFSILASATFAIYGILGTSALSVIQVAEVVANMAQVVFFGLGNAAAVTIGGALGLNDDKTAYEYARITVKLACILCVLVCSTIFVIARPVSAFYDFDPKTIELLVQVLYVWAIITVPKMLGYVFVCGILRAGGDTMFTLYIDIGGNILLQIPLALLAVVVLELPLPFCILMVTMNDCVKLVIFIWRFFSKKWINMYNKAA
ncbi:MAG: MATE family efflux transporter [Firmicutes bacterium]|nr:MATE family efflux transporter [Bacillota bacterium]